MINLEDDSNKYTDDYLATHDIDWFCVINKTPIHAASNGGDLPLDIKNNRLLNEKNKRFVFNRKRKNKYNYDEININIEHLNKVIKNPENYSPFEIIEMKNNYLRTFIDMARRGFYSYDRLIYKEFEDQKYILVAWPKNPSSRHSYNIRKGITNFRFESEKCVFKNIETVIKLDFNNI